MTSIPSFDQQLNIRALFIDALDYGVKGGLVCDWINGMGYHAEQAYFNFAAGAAMLWSGTDKDSFIVNCSREKFEKDSLFVRYGADRLFPRGGGYLRKTAFPFSARQKGRIYPQISVLYG